MDNQLTTYDLNGETFHILDNYKLKTARSKIYNYTFFKDNGLFFRWGKHKNDDPSFSPIGPELLDIEISQNGCPNNCPFCYKSNDNSEPINMSFDTFKEILDKFPKTLTQVAFGITGIQTNPDFMRMMQYCRDVGVIPNYTLSGIDLTDQLAEKSAELVGALAVSAYEKDINVCYNAVQKFLNLGIKQTNIHLLLSQETLEFVYKVLNDNINDPRLKGLNAVVFLGVKPKGRAKGVYHSVTNEQFLKLVTFCFDKNLRIGFDSCTAPKFEWVVNNLPDLSESKKKHLLSCSESCESSLFSSYINVHGEYWNCSFMEGQEQYEPVNVLECGDFLMDLWYSDPVKKFRKDVLATVENGCRKCPVFNI